MINTKIIGLLIFISMLAVPVLLFTSCHNKTEQTSSSNAYYTCSMHPQIHESHPGNCPICHMKLIKVEGSTSENSTDLSLTAEQIQLGGIQTDTVKVHSISKQLSLNGIVKPDQNKINSVSAWISGRIEKLYVKNTGDYVGENQPVYDLYSEDLLNTEQNLLGANAQFQNGANKDYYESIFRSAKNKLLLWGISDSQIESILKLAKPKNPMTIYSRYSGVVTSLAVHEGDYLNEGDLIMQVTDLSVVWVEAQVYDADLSAIHNGMKADVQLAEGASIDGTVSSINPELMNNSQIAIIRIVMSNHNNEYQPGMQANVFLKIKQKQALAVPSTSILTDEKGSSVWIKNNSGNFEIRMVSAGISDNKYTEIVSGLEEGNLVVTAGAYLLYNDYILNKGENPMAGMKM